MTPREVKVQADQVISFLVSAGLADDQNYPLLRTVRGVTEISFQTDNLLAAALKNRPYEETYHFLRENRVYSALMLDGAILQMSYAFVGNQLERHRLAFFPAPDLSPFHDDPEVFAEDAVYADVLSRSVMVVPLRFDFDDRDGVHIDLDHPISHLSLGQYEHCRVPVSSAISPLYFLEFIMRSFYFLAHKERSDQFPQCSGFATMTMTEAESCVVHISVPK